MQVLFHASFDKKYRKLSQKIVLQAENRLALFVDDSSNPQLHNHPLHGEYEGCFSINITGDYRAIYELINEHTARFLDIDTHSKLYKK